MSGISKSCVAGAVLCGGLSSRLGGDKAQTDLGGQSLLNRVITRLEPQVDRIILSVQKETHSGAATKYTQIPDVIQSHRGPLMGLYSALKSLDDSPQQWLALCPCDAPFLPGDLVNHLLEAATKSAAAVSTVSYEGVVQPTFSLWHREMTDEVGRLVLEQGRGGLMSMLDQLEHTIVDWPQANPPPFFNINTSAELAHASQLLDLGAVDV